MTTLTVAPREWRRLRQLQDNEIDLLSELEVAAADHQAASDRICDLMRMLRETRAELAVLQQRVRRR